MVTDRKRKKIVTIRKRGIKMATLTLIQEPERLTCMANLRKMAQTAIKKNGASETEVRKSLGIKRYEKKN